MNIIIVTRDITSGIGTTVKNLVWQFEKMPEINLITVIAPGRFEVKTQKVKFNEVKLVGKYFFTKEPFFAVKASSEILKELNKNHYDVVNLHTNIFNFSFKNRVKIVSSMQVSHTALFSLHTNLRDIKYFFGKILHLPFIFFDRRTVKNSHKVICVSKFTIKDLERFDTKDKFIYLPNGVDSSIYHPIEIDRMKFLKDNFQIDASDKKILLYIGRIENGKGISILVKIIESLKDVLLLVVGDGPEVKNLLGKKNIKYLGYISNQELKNKVLNVSDIFVFASLYENFPSVICEAMASGLPILSTRVGMVPELLDGREESLVKVNDISEFKTKLINLLDNAKIRKQEADVNIAYALKNLNWSNIAKEYLILFKNLINGN